MHSSGKISKIFLEECAVYGWFSVTEAEGSWPGQNLLLWVIHLYNVTFLHKSMCSIHKQEKERTTREYCYLVESFLRPYLCNLSGCPNLAFY